MKYWYRIDAESNLIYLKCKGKVKPQEISRPTNDIISNPLFEKGMDTIADISELEISKDLNITKLFRGFLKTIQDIRGPCKWVVVAQENIAFEFAKPFELISRNFIIKTKIFQNHQDAIKWIITGSLN